MKRKTLEILIFSLLGFCAVSGIIYQCVTVSYKYGHAAGHAAGHELGKYANGLARVSAYGEGYNDGFLVGQNHPNASITEKRSEETVVATRISIDNAGELLIEDILEDE